MVFSLLLNTTAKQKCLFIVRNYYKKCSRHKNILKNLCLAFLVLFKGFLYCVVLRRNYVYITMYKKIILILFRWFPASKTTQLLVPTLFRIKNIRLTFIIVLKLWRNLPIVENPCTVPLCNYQVFTLLRPKPYD